MKVRHHVLYFLRWYVRPQGVFSAPLRQIPRLAALALLRAVITCVGLLVLAGIVMLCTKP